MFFFSVSELMTQKSAVKWASPTPFEVNTTTDSVSALWAWSSVVHKRRTKQAASPVGAEKNSAAPKRVGNFSYSPWFGSKKSEHFGSKKIKLWTSQLRRPIPYTRPSETSVSVRLQTDKCPTVETAPWVYIFTGILKSAERTSTTLAEHKSQPFWRLPPLLPTHQFRIHLIENRTTRMRKKRPNTWAERVKFHAKKLIQFSRHHLNTNLITRFH